MWVAWAVRTAMDTATENAVKVFTENQRIGFLHMALAYAYLVAPLARQPRGYLSTEVQTILAQEISMAWF